MNAETRQPDVTDLLHTRDIMIRASSDVDALRELASIIEAHNTDNLAVCTLVSAQLDYPIEDEGVTLIAMIDGWEMEL